MAGAPRLGMLAGADLVIDTQDIKVLLGAQVEHAYVPSGDEPDQVVGAVVGGNQEPGRPVPLAERTQQSPARVPRPERAGRGVEAVAGVGKPLPCPSRRFRRVNPPDL